MAHTQIVRLQRDGRRVEVLAVLGKALEFRQGAVPWHDVLVADVVYDDVRKGRKTSKADLLHLFDTDDAVECCKAIVETGEIPLSTAQRAAIAKDKREQVVKHFCDNYKRPYFLNGNLRLHDSDVEDAMVAAKVRVDADSDVQQVIRKSRRAMQDQIRASHIDHEQKKIRLKCDEDQRDRLVDHLAGRPVSWKVEDHYDTSVIVKVYTAVAMDELKRHLQGWSVKVLA